jgi:hypothetical protein
VLPDTRGALLVVLLRPAISGISTYHVANLKRRVFPGIFAFLLAFGYQYFISSAGERLVKSLIISPSIYKKIDYTQNYFLPLHYIKKISKELAIVIEIMKLHFRILIFDYSQNMLYFEMPLFICP